jgi:hypothetical protein
MYVAKGITMAFVTPSLTEPALDPHVLFEWISLSLALPKWNEKCLIATAVSDELPASSTAIEIQQTLYCNKALMFKTPAKCKPVQDAAGEEIPDLLDLVPYLPFFKPKEDVPVTEVAYVTGVLVQLDKGIASNNDAILTLIDDYRIKHLKAGNAITALWLRIEAFAATVGVSPTHLENDYLAPSAWVSFGAMAANLVDSMDKCMSNQGSLLNSHKSEVQAMVATQINMSHKDFFQPLDSFKAALIGALARQDGQCGAQVDWHGLQIGQREHDLGPHPWVLLWQDLRQDVAQESGSPWGDPERLKSRWCE